MFEPDQLEGTDLNNWILKRKAWAIIDSLLERVDTLEKLVLMLTKDKWPLLPSQMRMIKEVEERREKILGRPTS